MVELSIVMPCLNESRTIGLCIKRAKNFLATNKIKGEVVIGDNGSTDGSQQIAHKYGAEVVPVETRGYGAALLGACQKARGKYIIMGDADDSYHFDECLPILNELRNGADLVMGNRFAGGIQKGAMPWKNRYIGNPVLSFLGRLFFKVPVRDFHCGMRGFTKTAFVKMDLRTTGMEFASEMVIKAALRKLQIAEVPIKLYKDGRDRPPHLRPWRDGWRHLRFMLLYSPRWLFLYPGMILMLLGLLFGIYIFSGDRVIFGIRPQTHSLLFCSAAVILGFQAILYSYLAKSFAIREGLLTADKLTRFFDSIFSLETGLLAGILLFLLGFGLSVYGLQIWMQHDFGNLGVTLPIKMSIAAITLLVLGLEFILFSFFSSVLHLGVKRS